MHFVTTFHGTYNLGGSLKWHYNAIMTRGDRVIAISSFIGEHVSEHYGVGDDRLRVVSRGLDVVDFDPAAVRRLLRDNGVAHAETMSKPVVVVAVHRDDVEAALWDEANPWRQAWDERRPRGGLVPLVLPLGDIVDLSTLGADEALSSDPDALSALAARYGTSEVVVAVGGIPELGGVSPFELDSEPDAEFLDPTALESDVVEDPDNPSVEGLAMTLSVRRIGVAGARGLDETLIGQPGETRQTLFGRAVERVVAILEHDWKLANLVRFDSESALRVAVPIRGLNDWVALRQRLEALAVISAVDIGSLSRDNAEVTLRYYGNPDQLRLALDQADLALTSFGGGWILETQDAVRANGDGGPRRLEPAGTSVDTVPLDLDLQLD